MLLWIYTCAFILCSYCITSSSNFAMLHNVNLNIINLNTLTLCLSICNRMAPPTSTSYTPFLRWSTITHTEHTSWLTPTQRCPCPTPTLATLPLCCLQIQRDRGILTLLGLSWLCQTNIVVWNLQTHEPMKMLCGNLSSIYLLHIRFNLRTVTIALVVVYNTENSSIEAGRFLSASLPRRGLWRGRTSGLWRRIRDNFTRLFSF